MKKSQHKKSLFRKALPWAATAATLGLAGWFVFGNSGLWEQWKLEKLHAAQATQIQLLESQKKLLETQLSALKSKDKLAMESAAREFGMVASDEMIYEIKVDSSAKK